LNKLLIMSIRPIKTEADYQDALEEIERLFDAAPNTPVGTIRWQRHGC